MKLRLLAMAIVLVALVGCGSGGPSADAIQASVQEQGRAQLRKVQEMAISMGGDRDMLRRMGQPSPEELSIENVEILESEPLDNGDYRVNFTADVVMGDQRNTRSMQTIVKNTDDGWYVVVPN